MSAEQKKYKGEYQGDEEEKQNQIESGDDELGRSRRFERRRGPIDQLLEHHRAMNLSNTSERRHGLDGQFHGHVMKVVDGVNARVRHQLIGVVRRCRSTKELWNFLANGNVERVRLITRGAPST